MAAGVSGSIQIDAYDGYSMRVDYSETYDVAGNYSTVTINGVYIRATSWYGHTYYPDGIVKVNGTAVLTMNSAQGTGNARTNALNQWYLCSNSSATSGQIAHNADGTKTVTIEVVGNRYSTFRWYTSDGTGSSGWGGTGSKSVALTTIPRASSFTVNNATIGGTITFTITRASSAFTHTISYTVPGKSSETLHNKTTSVSPTWKVPDLSAYRVSPATTVTATFTMQTYSGNTAIGSPVTKTATISLPGANTIGNQSVTVGTAKTISFTQNLSSYKSTVEVNYGSSGWKTIGTAQTTGTSVSWPSTNPATWGGYIPNDMSKSGTIRITTYANSTSGYQSIGSKTATLTVSIPDYSPSGTFSTHAIVNDNATIAGWGVAVKGYTKYQWGITSVATSYGATIKSYSFSVGGRTGNAVSGTTAAMTTSGSTTPTMVITDSRNKSVTLKATAITVYDYGPPVIVSSYAYRSNASGTRQDDGTYVSMLINAKTDYTCGGHNIVSVQGRTYLDGVWYDWYSLTNNVRAITDPTFVITKSYRVEMRVIDALGSTKSITYTIPTASVAFNLKDGGKGAAFFGYAQADDTLEVYGELLSGNPSSTAEQRMRVRNQYGSAYLTTTSGYSGLAYNRGSDSDSWIIRSDGGYVSIPTQAHINLRHNGGSFAVEQSPTTLTEIGTIDVYGLAALITIKLHYNNSQPRQLALGNGTYINYGQTERISGKTTQDLLLTAVVTGTVHIYASWDSAVRNTVEWYWESIVVQ